ncbi:hypothetical protein KIP88_45010 [Bradyrhizobium sp. SRL28]|nr:hypothetical protein [Bradyrhizobium sp. SRL28]
MPTGMVGALCRVRDIGVINRTWMIQQSWQHKTVLVASHAVDFPGRHHRPDDPSQLVGNGDSDDHGSTPFKQSFDPAASDPEACLWVR